MGGSGGGRGWLDQVSLEVLSNLNDSRIFDLIMTLLGCVGFVSSSSFSLPVAVVEKVAVTLQAPAGCVGFLQGSVGGKLWGLVCDLICSALTGGAAMG